MSVESEKICALEARLYRAEKDINEIRDMFQKSSEATKKNEINYVELTGQLSKLTDNLKDHNNWHAENKQNRVSWTNIIISVGMLLIAIFQIYQASQMQKMNDRDTQPVSIARGVN